jgi:Protein of unknown function (DUF5661)
MNRKLEELFSHLRANHSKVAEVLSGGIGDNTPDSDFNPSSLSQGMGVEKEHTSSPAMAKEIAKDHLSEDPDYYKKLKLIEGKGKKAPAFTIKSKTSDKLHKLKITKGAVKCSCPGFRYRQSCHHVHKFKDSVKSGDMGKHGIKKLAALLPNIFTKLAAERDYKDEYAKFQSSRESKVDRAHRNKVRRRLLASGRVEKHDGKDIDHKDGNPRNNGGGNISVTSKSYNRGKH